MICCVFGFSLPFAEQTHLTPSNSSAIWRGNDSLMKPHNNSRAFTINSFFLCACIMQHSDKKILLVYVCTLPVFHIKPFAGLTQLPQLTWPRVAVIVSGKRMQRASHRLRRDMTSIYWLRCCANAAKSGERSPSLDEISIAL